MVLLGGFVPFFWAREYTRSSFSPSVFRFSFERVLDHFVSWRGFVFFLKKTRKETRTTFVLPDRSFFLGLILFCFIRGCDNPHFWSFWSGTRYHLRWWGGRGAWWSHKVDCKIAYTWHRGSGLESRCMFWGYQRRISYSSLVLLAVGLIWFFKN